VVEVGELRLDLEKRLVTMHGRPVSLTPIEYGLLRLFAENEASC
jgi:DNA-binding response OmpR family regulator